MFHRLHSPLLRLAAGILVISFIILLSRMLDSLLAGHSLFLLLGGVIFCALYGGMGVGVVTASIAALAHNYFYQFPEHSVWIHTYSDALQLVLFLLVATILSWIGNQLRKARTEAEISVRAREDMIAVVSHDLKNPLTSIKMNAELIARARPEADARELRLARNIIESVDQMSRLVSDLLDYEKIRAGRFDLERREVAVTTLLENAKNLLQPLADGKGVALRVDPPTEQTTLGCAPDRILQVFSNLIGNAIKFTPAGGSVAVSVARLGGELRFSVKDTGIGISEANLPHIFDRYWQAGPTARQGNGLGLAIARGIVVAHQGAMAVESRKGEGTTFSFTLPLRATGSRGLRTQLQGHNQDKTRALGQR